MVTLCPHCGASLEPAARVCPNCGADVRALQLLSPNTTPALPPKLLTGRTWGDFLLGAAAQYLAHLAATRVLVRMVPRVNPANFYDFVGLSRDWDRDSIVANVTLLQVLELIVLGALGYFLGRRSYPAAARGFGYATLALFVVLLGALFTCHLVSY